MVMITVKIGECELYINLLAIFKAPIFKDNR